jgi:hypothetical protein
MATKRIDPAIIGFTTILLGCRPGRGGDPGSSEVQEDIRITASCAPDRPRASDALATVVWKNRPPGYFLAFGSRGVGGLCSASPVSPQKVARFIVPAGHPGFQYAIIEENGARPRWVVLEDRYSCDPGGRFEIQLTTTIAADGKVKIEAQYASQGCRTPLLGDVSNEETLQMKNDRPPPPICCSNGPKQWRED